jgi:hypothetical protein
MRLTLVSVAVVVAGCTSNPTADTTQPVDRACAVDTCFYERDVRDFEVINQTTLIVYVGSQRCAFEVELRGTFCDLSFAPELYFYSPSELSPDNERDAITGGSASSRLGDLRICRNDINVSVSGGVFTQSGATTPTTVNRRAECQISSVEALTDDELVELYVSKGAPPPPPIGSGEIKVGEQEEQGTEAPAPPGETPPSPTTTTPSDGTAQLGTQPSAKAVRNQ